MNRLDSRDLARILGVLSSDTRVQIVRLLHGRALCVNALAGQLAVTQAAVSQHLRVMRDAGLVIDEKRGYHVHYHLNENTLAVWREEIHKLLDPQHGPGPDTKGRPLCAAAMKKGRKAARTPRT